MKTADLTTENPTLSGLLAPVRKESVSLQNADGGRFILSVADDFSVEVELLRRNREFPAFLDSCKVKTATVSPDEVEERLR